MTLSRQTSQLARLALIKLNSLNYPCEREFFRGPCLKNMDLLERLRNEALQSQQWKALYDLIMIRVRTKLESQGTNLFTDLSDTEQQIFMDELEKEMQGGSPEYHVFRESLGGSLDALLLPLTKPPPPQPGAAAHPLPAVHTRLAAAVATDLLRSRPDRLAELRAVCCRGLPPALRRAAWAARLAHHDARAEYEGRLAGEDGGGGRLAVTSRRDADIAAACRAALDGELGGEVSADHLHVVKVPPRPARAGAGAVPPSLPGPSAWQRLILMKLGARSND